MMAVGRRDSALLRWKKFSILLLRITDFKDRERFNLCNCKTMRRNKRVEQENQDVPLKPVTN